MFSLRELNNVMRMDYPRHKIVNWHPGHMNLIELNEFDKDNFYNQPQNLENFYRYAETGLAFTGIGDGIIYAMFGLWEKWRGVSEAWLISSKNINRKTIAFKFSTNNMFQEKPTITFNKLCPAIKLINNRTPKLIGFAM